MRTRYTVDGWGEGELWTGDGVVLAHDFRFTLDRSPDDVPRPGALEPAADVGSGAPTGGAKPPSGTVAANPSQVGGAFVTTVRQYPGSHPGDLVRRIGAFFSGEDAALGEVPLDLDSATPFQRDVTTALRAVPRGEVVSYGELAALAGYPRAGRAVGTLCATNRFMLFVPCHRVVATDGIGGYGSAGVEVKRRLLELEGVEL